jgi:prevent-host-death family protein
MLEYGAFAAKNKLGTLLDLVEAGEEIIITRHGKPIARLVPNFDRPGREEARLAAKRIRERAAQHPAVVAFDWESVKVDRDAGRP